MIMQCDLFNPRHFAWESLHREETLAKAIAYHLPCPDVCSTQERIVGVHVFLGKRRQGRCVCVEHGLAQAAAANK